MARDKIRRLIEEIKGTIAVSQQLTAESKRLIGNRTIAEPAIRPDPLGPPPSQTRAVGEAPQSPEQPIDPPSPEA